jgi:hypothetical protein
MNELRSARGLFKATGKVAKPIARVAQDFYRTPPEVTRALLRVEGDRLASFNPIWEPAAGDGAITYELARIGMVISSDIADRGCPHVRVKSFFDYTTPPARAIVTNPPYSLVNWRDGKAHWIHHALFTLNVEYMALLLPWTWPAASGLKWTWDVFPPSIVYLLTWKVDFTGQGAPPQNNAWFVWDRGHRGETILRRLDREEEQEKLI